jgi:protease-4
MAVIRFIGKCILWVCAGLGVLLILGTAGSIIALRHVATAPVRMPDHAALTLDLADGVTEQPIHLPFDFGHGVAMPDLVQALHAAAQDKRVDRLVLYVGRGNINMAQVQEIRDAVSDFKKSGKKVEAFAESFGEGGDGTVHYYLASIADKIVLQPSGDLRLIGFHLETPFLKGIFDRIGITARMGQRKEFKGAVNTFTQASMPDPQRQNMQQLADSWLHQVVTDVAHDRKLDPQAVKQAIDQAPMSAEDGKKAGLIDVLAYRDAVDHEEDQTAEHDKSISVTDYVKTMPAAAKGSPKIATIYGTGPVVLAPSDADPFRGSVTMGSDTLREAFDSAIADHVSAIILRVDSPGGSYTAADTIWRSVNRARAANIPVIVSMSGVAASGGYFVAAPATRIVAEPGTITGSIGVFGGKIIIDGLLKNISVGVDGISAGAQADIDSAVKDFSPSEWQNLQHSLDVVYADFTGKVSSGRHLDPAKTEEIAQGQIWTGADAKERGLVDALGGWDVAIDLAKQEAGLKKDQEVALVEYPSNKQEAGRFIEKLFRSEASQSSISAALLQDGLLQQWARRFGLVDALAGKTGTDHQLPELALPPLMLNGALL